MRKVGDAHEAEEIAQEAFARAYVAFPNLGGPRHAYAWLSVVASRLCIDSHRRRARTHPSSEVDRDQVVIDDDRLEAKVDVDHLRTALERLTPRHREVLNLREHDEWSYRRIAQHYGVSLGTVEALLFRARTALRREFAAVAGAGRELAALPVIGAVFRRLAAFRERFEPWVTPLSSAPLAELATIVALVAGVGMALGPVGGAEASPRPVALASGGGDARGFARMGVPDTGTRATRTPAAPRGPRGATDPAGGSQPAPVPVAEPMDFASARRNAEEQPTHASTETVAIGVDPDEGAQETAEAAQTYSEQAQDWIERNLP
jgi:RNA polymerase sigma-70 factor (ECF subfamily)